MSFHPNTHAKSLFFASKTENNFASVRSGFKTSSVGKGKWLLFRALFRSCGSRQILSSPLGLLAVSKLDTPSVGSYILLMISSFSSLSNCSFILGLTATGTLCGGFATGRTYESTFRLSSPSSNPVPSTTSENLLRIVY